MNKVTNNLAIKKSSMAVCLLISFLISSCSEESLTKGVITVYDINGSTVSGVEVLLTQKEMGPGITQTDVQDRQISDYKGQTEHICTYGVFNECLCYPKTRQRHFNVRGKSH